MLAGDQDELALLLPVYQAVMSRMNTTESLSVIESVAKPLRDHLLRLLCGRRRVSGKQLPILCISNWVSHCPTEKL
jgi:hypothetical protein